MLTCAAIWLKRSSARAVAPPLIALPRPWTLQPKLGQKRTSQSCSVKTSAEGLPGKDLRYFHEASAQGSKKIRDWTGLVYRLTYSRRYCLNSSLNQGSGSRPNQERSYIGVLPLSLSVIFALAIAASFALPLGMCVHPNTQRHTEKACGDERRVGPWPLHPLPWRARGRLWEDRKGY